MFGILIRFQQSQRFNRGDELFLTRHYSVTFHSEVYCGKDKGMPNGWSFNWESMATEERENLETRCVDSLLVLYVLQ